MPERSVPPYEEIDHTADLALRVHGADLEELFTNAARGMFHLVCASRPGRITDSYPVHLESPDAETLLIDWLNELLFLSEVHGRILSAFDFVHIDETMLDAHVDGGPFEQMRVSIKAATFHDLSIHRDEQGYTVTIVFDV